MLQTKVILMKEVRLLLMLLILLIIKLNWCRNKYMVKLIVILIVTIVIIIMNSSLLIKNRKFIRVEINCLP